MLGSFNRSFFSRSAQRPTDSVELLIMARAQAFFFIARLHARDVSLVSETNKTIVASRTPRPTDSASNGGQMERFRRRGYAMDDQP
jgi:hypothetical protein